MSSPPLSQKLRADENDLGHHGESSASSLSSPSGGVDASRLPAPLPTSPLVWPPGAWLVWPPTPSPAAPMSQHLSRAQHYRSGAQQQQRAPVTPESTSVTVPPPRRLTQYVPYVPGVAANAANAHGPGLHPAYGVVNPTSGNAAAHGPGLHPAYGVVNPTSGNAAAHGPGLHPANGVVNPTSGDDTAPGNGLHPANGVVNPTSGDVTTAPGNGLHPTPGFAAAAHGGYGVVNPTSRDATAAHGYDVHTPGPPDPSRYISTAAPGSALSRLRAYHGIRGQQRRSTALDHPVTLTASILLPHVIFPKWESGRNQQAESVEEFCLAIKKDKKYIVDALVAASARRGHELYEKSCDVFEILTNSLHTPEELASSVFIHMWVSMNFGCERTALGVAIVCSYYESESDEQYLQRCQDGSIFDRDVTVLDDCRSSPGYIRLTDRSSHRSSFYSLLQGFILAMAFEDAVLTLSDISLLNDEWMVPVDEWSRPLEDAHTYRQRTNQTVAEVEAAITQGLLYIQRVATAQHRADDAPRPCDRITCLLRAVDPDIVAIAEDRAQNATPPVLVSHLLYNEVKDLLRTAEVQLRTKCRSWSSRAHVPDVDGDNSTSDDASDDDVNDQRHRRRHRSDLNRAGFRSLNSFSSDAEIAAHRAAGGFIIGECSACGAAGYTRDNGCADSSCRKHIRTEDDY